jgi:AbrB family looped-hinge helix DNA binding protein
LFSRCHFLKTEEEMPLHKSKSEKMRELAAQGLARADIARRLGVRYQFVRNVLEREKAKKQAGQGRGGFSDRRQAEMTDSAAVKVRLGPDGRIVVPAGFRDALNLKEGDVLFARLDGDEVQLLTPKAAMRRARRMLRQFVSDDANLANELIEERRREAKREQGRG